MAVRWLSSREDAWQPYRALELELTSVSDSDWIIMQVEGGRVMGDDATATIGFEIPPSGGSGYIMFTGENFDTIVSGSAVGQEWSQGTVSETIYTCFPAITGIKPVWVSGTIKLVIVL